MFEKYFHDVLKYHPSFASFLGDRSRDGEVEVSLSQSFRNKWSKVLSHYEHMLRKNPSSDIDSETLNFALKEERMFLDLPFHLLPISSFTNHVLDFTFMENTLYPKGSEDNMLARHKSYMKTFNECIRCMKEGIAKKTTLPKIICERLIQDIENFVERKNYIVNKDLTSFFEDHYRGEIQKLLHFLKNEYLLHCRDSIGLCDVPKGKEMYTALLVSNTTLYISPEEIHKMGMSEVRRITAAFKSLMAKIYPGQDLDVPTFLQKFKSDPRHFLKGTDAILNAYKNMQQTIRKEVIPKYFYDQVTPYEIRRVPKMLQSSSAGAFYYPGNNIRPGRFFVNLRDTKENPKYTIETLTMHEGEPGHHYQFQYMLDKKLPMYKIFGTQGNAFTEGWALYAESLSPSTDPAVIFGRLTFEMLRAVRCVVDTGIHYYGWTFQRALSYMKKHIALMESELSSELIRYICIPGQATAYKVGEQFFKRQKDAYFKKGHDIKDYHKIVLDNGVLPLYVLEKILTS